jgi:hypothetical protein
MRTHWIILVLIAISFSASGQTFDEFRADTSVTVTLMPIDYNSNPTAKRFKTRITNGYKSGTNFAWRYTFVQWGCGSPCKASAIVDSKTGKVYDGPGATIGYEFQKESKLIIVNPKSMLNPSFGPDFPWWSKEERWVWNEDKKIFEKLDKQE